MCFGSFRVVSGSGLDVAAVFDYPERLRCDQLASEKTKTRQWGFVGGDCVNIVAPLPVRIFHQRRW